MSTVDRIQEIVEPLLTDLGVELVDIEHSGPTLRITIDQPGGVGMDALTASTRAVSRALDTHDPLPGRYTLEISSPGLERPLKKPEHFARAKGDLVKIKTLPQVEGDRRVEGTISAVDDDGIVVTLKDDTSTERRLAYGEISKARTVFEWGPTPKPGGPKKKGGSSKHPKSGGEKSGGQKSNKGKAGATKQKSKAAASKTADSDEATTKNSKSKLNEGAQDHE